MRFLDDPFIPDHPYPELRQVLELFVDGIAAELRENLVGVYLVGSIASGDFDLDSDVDFLVVTRAELTSANMRSLQDLQIRIHAMDCYPAKHLEGSYISLRDLQDWSTVGQKKLYYFDNGSTTAEQSTHDNQWHVRWVLRERGITLVGPKPGRILEPIPPKLLINEMKTVMLTAMQIFQEEMDRPLGFCNSRFGQSFFVLTYCRMLHTLYTGTVESKKAASAWARRLVDPAWVKLIEQAWDERQGVRFGVKIGQRADSALLQETLEFIKYTVGQMDTIKIPFNSPS